MNSAKSKNQRSPLINLAQKKYGTTKWRINSAIVIVFVLAFILVACQTSPLERNTERMVNWSFDAEFNFKLLGLIRSNQVQKVQGMLELRTFLLLQQVWETAGEAGVETNRVCNQTFRDIYPYIRQQVPLAKFQPFPLSQRQSLTNFVRFADRTFLAK